eukprot:scaffold1379_cov209-Alexandrium_tamarense.AAC.25
MRAAATAVEVKRWFVLFEVREVVFRTTTGKFSNAVVWCCHNDKEKSLSRTGNHPRGTFWGPFG